MRRSALAAAVLALLALGPAAQAAIDRRAPSASIDTPPGSTRVGAPAAGGRLTDVTGRAADDASGVRGVQVLFCPNARTGEGWSCGTWPVPAAIERRRARLSCTANGLRCSWSVGVPVLPGRYLAFVEVTDRAGRVGRAGPVDVLVV